MIPGAGYAFRVIHPGSPMLRIRYRRGVSVGPHGFPDWTPYARALVELPPATAGTGIDQARLLDVLTANAAAMVNDPLWTDRDLGTTPEGWTWAHIAMSRRIALVPVELHAAYRHLGGVSTGDADRTRRGLTVPPDTAAPPTIRFTERLSEAAVDKAERRLGFPLPPAYREFLSRTNGGGPAGPAMHPGLGFVLDRPLFGLARTDWLTDLIYANAWFGDRLTSDFLAIGYVQGGLLAIRVRDATNGDRGSDRGGERGSVWYWDDDDPRDRAEYSADQICTGLLHRCASDFATFWRGLREVPESLRAEARDAVEAGLATLVVDDRLGAALPPNRRAPGHPR